MSRESLDSLFEGEWSPCRRFAVWQGKYRPIDDFSECRVNACFGCFEKVTLKALDELVWTCALVFRVARAKGSVRLELGSGEVLEGPLHKVWHDPSRVRPHTKTYDLRSAYKQLAIHPSERRKAVLLLKCPIVRRRLAGLFAIPCLSVGPRRSCASTAWGFFYNGFCGSYSWWRVATTTTILV